MVDDFLGKLGRQRRYSMKQVRHAKIMKFHDTHGWLIAALSHEMSGLESKAMFEYVECSFALNHVSAREGRNSPNVAKYGHAALRQRGRRVGKNRMASGSCPTPKEFWNRCYGT